MKSAFKTVALVGKYKSPEVAAPLLKLARFLERRKVEVLMDRVAGSRVGGGRYPVPTPDPLARPRGAIESSSHPEREISG